MTTPEADPLMKLLVNAHDVDRERLADGIQHLVAIDSRTGDPVFRSDFDKLNAKQKVIAIILGRKAAVLVGKQDEESIGPAAIGSTAGIPNGTVRRSLKELREDRLVSQEARGRYVCLSHQLNRAVEYLKTG